MNIRRESPPRVPCIQEADSYGVDLPGFDIPRVRQLREMPSTTAGAHRSTETRPQPPQAGTTRTDGAMMAGTEMDVTATALPVPVAEVDARTTG